MKLLVLHASAGGGHRRAAEALERAARARRHEVVVRDLLDFTSPLFRQTYAKGYLALVRSAPELWGYLYAQSDRSAQTPVERRLQNAFNQLNALPFAAYCRRTGADALLCTHFLPLELAGSLSARVRRSLRLYGVVTDFAAHSLWFCRGVDHYMVATEEARRQLVRKGQPFERIDCTGIPVMPEFVPGPEPAVVRSRLGLPSALPLVLVLNGGLGVGPALGLLHAFASTPPPGQVVIVAGRNARFEAKLRSAASGLPIPVHVYGFVDNVHEWMQAADIVISKPGGLTMAEALSVGRPVMMMDPIPGQEQRNGEYLLEAGCAVRAFDPDEAAWKIGELLANPVRLNLLAAASLRLGRPSAADDILRRVEAGKNENRQTGTFATRRPSPEAG